MKVAVLGLNETTLVALDAIASRGDMEPILLIPMIDGQIDMRVEPSPLNELNFGYPGVEESMIDFHIMGNAPWTNFRKGLYKAGFDAFMGSKPMTSSRRIFDKIKPLLSEVHGVAWNPQDTSLFEILDEALGGVDAIINVADRAYFCLAEEGDHTFLATRVWWSETKGQRIEPNHVVYNTTDAPAWAITSNIDGRNVTIWEHCPPFDDVHAWDLPTKMACNCETPGIDLHVGSWATYNPISPARAYEEIVEFLHSPMARSMEDADTLPDGKMDPI